jgi:hypothetical protein
MRADRAQCRATARNHRHDVDLRTERLVTYLNAGFGVSVNVVFFRHYGDEGRGGLARTWLIDEVITAARSAGTSRGRKPGGVERPARTLTAPSARSRPFATRATPANTGSSWPAAGCGSA